MAGYVFSNRERAVLSDSLCDYGQSRFPLLAIAMIYNPAHSAFHFLNISSTQPWFYDLGTFRVFTNQPGLSLFINDKCLVQTGQYATVKAPFDILTQWFACLPQLLHQSQHFRSLQIPPLALQC